MSNQADLEYGPTPESSEYEHTDIEPSIASKFAIWLAVAMVLSGALMYGTFWLLEGQAETTSREAQQFPLAAGQQKDPPAPRLQTQPFKDVYQLKQGQVDKLRSYGWVDQSTGVVHIPIDDAMRIVSERGLIPMTQQTPGVLNQMTQDSSAGRTTAPR
jgi:hypothetical protein